MNKKSMFTVLAGIFLCLGTGAANLVEQKNSELEDETIFQEKDWKKKLTVLYADLEKCCRINRENAYRGEGCLEVELDRKAKPKRYFIIFPGAAGKAGDTFTASCYIKSDRKAVPLVLYFYNCSGKLHNTVESKVKWVSATDKWKQVKFTYILTKDCDLICFGVATRYTDGPHKLYIDEVKIEPGKSATPSQKDFKAKKAEKEEKKVKGNTADPAKK